MKFDYVWVSKIFHPERRSQRCQLLRVERPVGNDFSELIQVVFQPDGFKTEAVPKWTVRRAKPEPTNQLYSPTKRSRNGP